MQPPRPTRQTISQTADGHFDEDAFSVMNARDNGLIESEILYGQGSSKFVYEFSIAGTTVSGISVVGARHLAAHYGGIKHKLVGSMQKQGSLFTFTSYPQPGIPMSVSCQIVKELEDEDDFYGAVVEVTDTHTGNVIQIEKRENRFEKKRDGSTFERPHFAVIAQSKAYRNAVLSLLPQDLQVEWKQNMIALGKNVVITESVLDEKRAAVLRFATSKGLSIHRLSVDRLTMDQIAGLSDAARAGLQSFKVAALSAGILRGDGFVQVGHDAAPAPPMAPPEVEKPKPVVDQSQQTSNARSAEQTQTARDPEPQRQAPPPKPLNEGAIPRGSLHIPMPPGAKPPPPPFETSEVVEHKEPPFIEYLADEVGEMVSDAGGPIAFRDPVSFAMRLLKMISDAPHARETLIENNEGGIEKAMSNAQANAMLVPLSEPAPIVEAATAFEESISSDKTFIPVEVPVNDGRRSYLAYAKICVGQLANIGNEVDFQAWLAANKPTIDALPATSRSVVEEEVGKAHARLSTPQQAKVDQDAETAQSFLAEIAAFKSFEEVLSWSKRAIPRTLVMRWRTDRPELFKLIDDAVTARKPAEGDA